MSNIMSNVTDNNHRNNFNESNVNNLEGAITTDDITNNSPNSNINSSTQQIIKVIDLDDLPPQEILRIIVAIGSRNLAEYLALIVNLENRSRKLSPQATAKILSTQSLSAPSLEPQSISLKIKQAPKNNANNLSK